jgi:hypothetical protein
MLYTHTQSRRFYEGPPGVGLPENWRDNFSSMTRAHDLDSNADDLFEETIQGNGLIVTQEGALISGDEQSGSLVIDGEVVSPNEGINALKDHIVRES